MMKLTINDIAKSLNLSVPTIERWIRQGRIPVQKSGSDYTIEQSILERWAEKHNLPFSPPRTINKPMQTNDMPLENLLPLMQRGGVLHNIKGENVESVFKNALASLSFLSDTDRKDIYEKLLEREQLNSTGIGKGVAIPHPRTPLEMDSPVILTSFFEKPVDFGAVDKQPVFVMFVLLSNSIKFHLHMLSRLSFCLRDDAFIQFLKTIPTETDFFAKISEMESRIQER